LRNSRNDIIVTMIPMVKAEAIAVPSTAARPLEMESRVSGMGVAGSIPRQASAPLITPLNAELIIACFRTKATASTFGIS
jgi:hypothetical protein